MVGTRPATLASDLVRCQATVRGRRGRNTVNYRNVGGAHGHQGHEQVKQHCTHETLVLPGGATSRQIWWCPERSPDRTNRGRPRGTLPNFLELSKRRGAWVDVDDGNRVPAGVFFKRRTLTSNFPGLGKKSQRVDQATRIGNVGVDAGSWKNIGASFIR